MTPADEHTIEDELVFDDDNDMAVGRVTAWGAYWRAVDAEARDVGIFRTRDAAESFLRTLAGFCV